MDEHHEADRVILDSDKLRCLAHPLRSRLLAALRLDGPATSAMLAVRLDTNTGATSYHLRELAKVGLVGEAPDLGTGRERYWRATHQLTSWTETDFDDDPDDRAAVEWLQGAHARLKQRWREDWLAERMTWSPAWRSAASLGDMQVRLTPDGLRALEADLFAVVEQYRHTAEAGAADASDGPGDADAAEAAEDVMVLIDVFPVREVRL